ncbi:MAG: hypothetical protein K6F30_00590, partial [Lachnospiraceae bacterium]|nr:hypothetical protein [Lachnospiraceae bacterium]
MTKGRTNKIYICMVVLSVVATLCDFLPYCFQYPLSDQTLFLANVINYGYFFSRNLCILLYILFLFSVSRTWYEVRPKKRMLIVTLPYFVIVAALVVNMFSPKLFYISQMTGYERRSMIYILYVVSGLYCILALMFLIYCRRFIVLQKWLALLSLLVLSSIAIVIQAMDERYHVEMFSMSISMLLMLLFVQKPEEQMDVHTHVFGWDAYRAELHKIEATKQKTMIGIVTFTNAEEVRAYLGDDRYNEYILNVMRKMEMNSKQVQSDNTVFFEYPGH